MRNTPNPGSSLRATHSTSTHGMLYYRTLNFSTKPQGPLEDDEGVQEKSGEKRILSERSEFIRDLIFPND